MRNLRDMKRRLCKRAVISIGVPVGESGGGSCTGTFERQINEGSGKEASLIIFCGTEEENSVHVSCECEALASLRHAHLGTFFLVPEGVMS
jgi:hypothetical protein